MKNYISTTDLMIWIAVIFCKLVLCLCLLRKAIFHRLPCFSVYIFASTAKSVLLFGIAFSQTYAVYYYVFHATGYILTLAAFLTLIECGRRVLPGLDLPQKEKAIGLLFAALMAVVIFASLWPMRYIEERVNLGAYLAIAVTFIFIAAYSRYLGLYWSRLVAGISASLGILYLIQGALSAITGHTLSTVVLFVRQINGIANILAVIVWIVVILLHSGKYTMTEADLRKIEEAFAQVEASLDKLDVKIA